MEAGRFDEYFDANVRLRMGEAALARLKARPDRYAELTGALAAPLGGLAARAARRDLLRAGSGSTTARRIRCPVAGHRGRARTSFPTVAMSRRVAAAIPGARLHVVAGGPHFPNRSHRAEVQAVIAAFLDHLDGVRS